MSDVRLTVAAHRSFPGNLLDGAVPNGGSGMQVASGLSDFGDAVGAAERDRSQAMLMFARASMRCWMSSPTAAGCGRRWH